MIAPNQSWRFTKLKSKIHWLYVYILNKLGRITFNRFALTIFQTQFGMLDAL